MSLSYTDALRRAIVASLLTATTETATFTSGTATLPAGVKGDAAVLVNQDGDTAGTGSSVSFQVQSSPHGAATWTNVGAAVAGAISGTAFRGLIPFDSSAVTGSDIQVVATVTAGSGSTPSYKTSLALLSWVP
jgi:ABC-type transport system substrate-binding protein